MLELERERYRQSKRETEIQRETETQRALKGRESKKRKTFTEKNHFFLERQSLRSKHTYLTPIQDAFGIQLVSGYFCIQYASI